MKSLINTGPKNAVEAVRRAQRRFVYLFIASIVIIVIQVILLILYPDMALYSVGLLATSIAVCGYFGFRTFYVIPKDRT
jgi:hypothetical protein